MKKFSILPPPGACSTLPRVCILVGGKYYFFKKEIVMRIGKIMILFWFIGFMEAFSANIVWNQTDSSWETTGNWLTSNGDGWTGADWNESTGTLAGNAYIGNGGVVSRTGNLIVTGTLNVGYYNSVNNDQVALNPGKGTLNIDGGLTVDNLYIGRHHGNTPTWTSGTAVQAISPGKGVVTFTGDLNVTHSLRVGRDGSGELILSPESGQTPTNVSIGFGGTDVFAVGIQGYMYQHETPFFTNRPGDPIRVDFTAAENVTVNVGDFLVGAAVGADVPYGGAGYHPVDSLYRFQPMSEVKLGENNEITASRLVVASSYSVVSEGANTLEFGEGTNVLNVDKMIVGFWKSEAYTEDAEGKRVPANIVSIRDGGTFTLNGSKGEKTITNLMVGYSDCATNNVSYGELDLNNASKVNMNLERLIIGMKLEQSGTSDSLRKGGGVGVLKLGNHATVTAERIQLGHKEASNITMDQNKITKGFLEFGGDSVVTTEHLYMGNDANLNMVGYSSVKMTGGTLMVEDGARFYDNIDFVVDGGQVTIKKVERTSTGRDKNEGGIVTPTNQTDALQMYAGWNLEIKNGGTFTVQGDINQNQDLILGGYYDFKITDGGQLRVEGMSTLANRLDMLVSGEGSQYSITEKHVFQAGDVRVNGTIQAATGTMPIHQIEMGTVDLIVEDGGQVFFEDGLETYGNVQIEIKSGNLEILGTVLMDATKQDYLDIEMDSGNSTSIKEWDQDKKQWKKQDSLGGWEYVDGEKPTTPSWFGNEDNDLPLEIHLNSHETIFVPARGSAPEGMDVDRKTVFNISGEGVCRLTGNLTAVGELNLNTSDNGVLTGMNIILTGTTHSTIDGKLFQFRQVERSGTDPFSLVIKSGVTSINSIGNSDASEAGTIYFEGGILSVGTMGTPEAHLNLVQTGNSSILNPVTMGKSAYYIDGNGNVVPYEKYGTTQIYGNYTVTEGGIIHLDLNNVVRDDILVLGNMTMTNAIMEIHVEGGVPVTVESIENGIITEYVILLTAEEFLTEGWQSVDAGGSTTYQWTGDSSDWYYQTKSVTLGGGYGGIDAYELRAYRQRTFEVPEPATWGMLLVGCLSLLFLRRCQGRHRKNV